MAETHFSGPLVINDQAAGTNYTILADASGNELLVTNPVASAVNQVQVRNAATGSAPIVAAVGDDTNVGLQLDPKGTGLVLFDTAASGSITAGAGGVGTITQNVQRGIVAIPALGILQGSAVTVDLTNNKVSASSNFHVTLGDNTHTAGTPYIVRATPGAGSATIVVSNSGAVAVNGTVRLSYLVLS